MREFFTIAIFKIKADIRMNKTTLNSQKEKHSMLCLRRATSVALPGLRLHLDFYPRSPCGERQLILPVKFTAWAFLSTLSLRRATIGLRCVGVFLGISIHALLAESDWRTCAACTAKQYFYPRSPCGERRMTDGSICLDSKISIHALLAESDYDGLIASANFCNFYPRSPCGERPPYFSQPATLFKFLSTLSLRRATAPA